MNYPMAEVIDAIARDGLAMQFDRSTVGGVMSVTCHVSGVPMSDWFGISTFASSETAEESLRQCVSDLSHSTHSNGRLRSDWRIAQILDGITA